MRHRKAGRTLGRKSAHRKAMYRNMATSLLWHERIKTTDAKAKELRKVVDRLITLGKRVTPDEIEGAVDDAREDLLARRLHAVRLARRWVTDREVLTKLFSDLGPRYDGRNGGYTRIIKLGARPGDNAPLSIIELVDAQLATESLDEESVDSEDSEG